MASNESRGQLYLNVEDHTEELISFITNNLEDEVLDEVDLSRLHAESSVASEPTTIAAVMILSSTAIYATARLIEKWLELQRQKDVRDTLRVAWDKDEDLGKAMLEIEKLHSNVIVSQGMPTAEMIANPKNLG